MAEKPVLISEERPNDDINEAIMNECFERFIYPDIIKAGVISKFELTPETERQVSGIDALFIMDGKEVKIDNKTRHSITNITDGFVNDHVAIELRTYNKYGTNRFTGWGIKPKETDFWLFAHILKGGTNGKTGKKADIAADNIELVKLELVKPSEFHRWLTGKEMPPEKLEELAKEFEGAALPAAANNEDTSLLSRTFKIDNFGNFKKKNGEYTAFMTISPDMSEMPVNLVVEEFVVDHHHSSIRMIWEKDKGIEIIPKHT